MPAEESLGSYRARRHFQRTPEPYGARERSPEKPIFVVQKHAASHLHYDFRLEVEGVLKSWAVPKGPSTHPRTMRLAMLTEDHPLEYSGFEGVIPEGEYGAGSVMVWDTGTYRNLRAEKPPGQQLSMQASFEEGKIEVWLDGQKLKGGYALIRTKRDEGRAWLLVKMRDEHADQPPDPEQSEPDSALTGRTMEEIASEGAKTR